MAFPTVQTTSSGNSGGNSSTHTVTMPSGTASGDLLIVFFSNDGTATASINATNYPGWSSLTGGANETRLSIFYKKLTAAQGSIVVDTSASEGSAWVVYRITGHDVPTNPEVGTAATGSSTSPDPPDLNPAGWGTEDTLWIAVESSDSSKTCSGYPLAGNNVTNVYSNSTHGCGIAVCSVGENAANKNPGTFTISGIDGWVAQTVAVRTTQAITASGGTASAASSVSGVTSTKDSFTKADGTASAASSVSGVTARLDSFTKADGTAAAASSVSGVASTKGSHSVNGGTLTAASSISGVGVTVPSIQVFVEGIGFYLPSDQIFICGIGTSGNMYAEPPANVDAEGGTASVASSVSGATARLDSFTKADGTASVASSVSGVTSSKGSHTTSGGTFSAVSSVSGVTVTAGGVQVSGGTLSVVSSVSGSQVAFGSATATGGTLSVVSSVFGVTSTLGNHSVSGGTLSAATSISGVTADTGGITITGCLLTVTSSVSGATATIGTRPLSVFVCGVGLQGVTNECFVCGIGFSRAAPRGHSSSGGTVSCVSSVVSPTPTLGDVDAPVGPFSVVASVSGVSVGGLPRVASGGTLSVESRIVGPAVRNYASVIITIDGVVTASATRTAVASGSSQLEHTLDAAAGAATRSGGTCAAASSVSSVTVSKGSVSCIGGTLTTVAAVIGPNVAAQNVIASGGLAAAASSVSGVTVLVSGHQSDGGLISAAASVSGTLGTMGSITLQNLIISAVSSVYCFKIDSETKVVSPRRMNKVSVEVRVHSVARETRVHTVNEADSL